MARIGLVTWWFNRGQAVVMRRLRGALEELGHETHVLARPSPKAFHRSMYVERTGVWDQPRITAASAHQIPWSDYERWLDATGVEAVVCFQNYAFDDVRRVRERGVTTLGCFMWEQFGPEHVDGARSAYDRVFALTLSGQERFQALGTACDYVPWGCHPEDLAWRRPPREPDGVVTYFLPGGYVSRRKPVAETVAAFAAVPDERLRLVVKFQGTHRDAITAEQLHALARADQRVTVVEGDLPLAAHMALFGAADVCLAPSRWGEGLGLHLFEAAALGIPTITTAAPPMDEVVRDGVEGVLVACTAAEPTRSGVPAVEPDPDGLRAAIARMADDAERAGRAADARAAASGPLAWSRTVNGVRALLASAGYP